MDGSSTIEERILSLRKKEKSYAEIASILSISKSTVAYWIGDNPESKKIKDILTRKNISKSRRRIRNVIKASKEKWAAWAKEAHEEAVKNFPALAKNPLFIAGIMIYWGEGDSKPKNPLRISNTDPRMIKLYVEFIKNILKVPEEKIRLGLIIYPDLSDTECKNFWAKITNLEKTNFMKTQYIRGYHPTKRLSHGICMVVVNSRQQKIKLLEWIDLFYKKSIIQ